MKVHILAILALVLSLCAACTTVTTGDGTAAKEPNWAVIELASQTSVKWATKLVLDNNPDYSAQVAVLNAGVSTLFAGTPTEEGLRAQVKALASSLTDQQAATYAAALMDGIRAYQTATGRTELIPTDEHVQAMVKAITTGIAEGVALHSVGGAK